MPPAHILVPWNAEGLHNSARHLRSWQGARRANTGRIQPTSNAARDEEDRRGMRAFTVPGDQVRRAQAPVKFTTYGAGAANAAARAARPGNPRLANRWRPWRAPASGPSVLRRRAWPPR